MNYPVHFSDDPGEQRRQWNRLLDEVDREIADEKAEARLFETDIGKVLEQKPHPQIVIKPGNLHARRAYELGMEDEYSNRMKARYGGEW
jgi:hypothetical protein